VYAREFDGEEHKFGVLGVDRGTLIMYDEETKSRWSQLFGKAISGTMEGRRLEKLPSTMTTWGQWKALHPSTGVYVKRSVPYSPRFTKETFQKAASMAPGPIRNDDLVLAFEGHVQARAYLLRNLAHERLVEDFFEGAPILLYVSEDLATARVYERKLDDRALSFHLTPEGELEDAETGSRFDPVTGEAKTGPLQGKRLPAFVSTYAVWFAWKHYRPDTIVDGEAR
jgi:hypothetical protein